MNENRWQRNKYFNCTKEIILQNSNSFVNLLFCSFINKRIYCIGRFFEINLPLRILSKYYRTFVFK